MKRVSENPPSRYPDRPIEQASAAWWVAKLKPRQEKAIAFDLIHRDIEYYLPMITKVTRRKDNNKPRKSILPLFPGYISFSAEKYLLRDVLLTNRVVNIIEIRHQKRFIGELMQVYSAIERGVVLEPCAVNLTSGTSVCVQSGPFRGIIGVIVRINDGNKLVLSVEGLGQAAMAIDASQVKPLD